MKKSDYLSKKSKPIIEIVGSVIIENSKGEILLVKSPKWSNRWVFPGGHIEVGEKIEDGLVREAFEETGLNIKSKGIVAFGELINPKDFFRTGHFIYFWIKAKTKNPKIKLDGKELTALKWLRPQKVLKTDLAPSFLSPYKKYLKCKNK